MKKLYYLILAVLASTSSLFAQVRIDGTTRYWSLVPVEERTGVLNSDYYAYLGFRQAIFAADQYYIYFFIEYNTDNAMFAPDSIYSFRILLDVDGNSTNGYSCLWNNSGADYMFEAAIDNSQENSLAPAMYRWKGGDATDMTNWEEIKDVKIDAYVGKPIDLYTGVKAIEGKIFCPSIFSLKDSLKIGVYSLGTDYRITGALPSANKDITATPNSMSTVKVIEQDSIYITENGLEYCVNFEKQTATIVSSYSYPSDLFIPISINFNGANYDVKMYMPITNNTLKNIELEEGWQELYYSLFRMSENLESVIFPSTMQLINDGCFTGCTGLQKMIVKAQTPPTIFAVTFGGVNREIPVYVPDESVEAYKADAFWGEFNIQPMSSLTQGIRNTTMGAKATKRIVNGQLLIDRNGKKYNAQGVEIK